MSDYRILSQSVRKLRSQLGLTQVEFAERLGKTPTTVTRYESHRPPTGKALVQLGDLAQASGLEQVAATFHHAFQLEMQGLSAEAIDKHLQAEPGPKQDQWQTIAEHWFSTPKPGRDFQTYVDQLCQFLAQSAPKERVRQQEITPRTPDETELVRGILDLCRQKPSKTRTRDLAIVYLLLRTRIDRRPQQSPGHERPDNNRENANARR
jgi:transcriptional regulator with XRE-family HTH domain